MADSSFLDKSLADLTKMKVMDLKTELKQRGLPITGNKNDLIERLQQSIQAVSDTEENDEDAILNEDEDVLLTPKPAPKVVEKTKPTPVAMSTPAKPVSLNRKVEEVPKTPVAAKTPVVAKTSVVTKPAPAEPVKKVEEAPKPVVEEPEVPKSVAEEDGEPEKKIIKLSEMGIKDRLEMRAKKFGLPPSDAARKEARKERFGITESNGTSNGKGAVISANGSVATVEQLKKRAERFGQSVSSLMDKAEQLEKIEQRKARFGTVEPIRELTNKVKIVK